MCNLQSISLSVVTSALEKEMMGPVIQHVVCRWQALCYHIIANNVIIEVEVTRKVLSSNSQAWAKGKFEPNLQPIFQPIVNTFRHTFRLILNRFPISFTSVSLKVILKSFFEPSDIVSRGKLPARERLPVLSRLTWLPNAEHVPKQIIMLAKWCQVMQCSVNNQNRKILMTENVECLNS